MEKKLISKKINIILENGFYEPSVNYLISGRKNIFDSNNIDVLLQEDLTKVSFVNDQVITLKSLYVQLPPNEREIFLNILVNIVKSSPSLGRLSLNTLVHIGQVKKVLAILKKWPTDYSKQESLAFLCNELGEIISNEWNLLKPDEIDYLTDWIENTIDGKNGIGADMRNLASLYKESRKEIRRLYVLLNILNTKNIKREVFSGFNPEINEDKIKLIEQFKKYDFPEDLSDALEKIDQIIATATDTFDYKSCMDLIRAFTERLFSSIAQLLDVAEGKNVNVKESEKVAAFFVKKGLISKDQSVFLISLRHFLSNDGSHKLKSKPEDARLSRNVVIEFSLYLLRRLKDVRSDEK